MYRCLTYSDPFGLCPDSLKTADGTCPGGITVQEWQQVESAQQDMSPEASTRTGNALYGGKIHGYNGNTPGEYGYVPTADGENIYLNRTFVGLAYQGSVFDNPAELTKTLLHESQHVEQYRGLSAAGRRKLFEMAGCKEVARCVLEVDADKYMDANYFPHN